MGSNVCSCTSAQADKARPALQANKLQTISEGSPKGKACGGPMTVLCTAEIVDHHLVLAAADACMIVLDC